MLGISCARTAPPEDESVTLPDFITAMPALDIFEEPDRYGLKDA